jgi:hypothetical protein
MYREASSTLRPGSRIFAYSQSVETSVFGSSMKVKLCSFGQKTGA